MTLVIKSSNEDTISLPMWLLEKLNLHEGDEIKTIIDGQTLHITPLDQFLALRGQLSDDQDFDEAMEFIDRAWQSWIAPSSV